MNERVTKNDRHSGRHSDGCRDRRRSIRGRSHRRAKTSLRRSQQDTTFFVTLDGQQEFSAGGRGRRRRPRRRRFSTGHDRHRHRRGVRRCVHRRQRGSDPRCTSTAARPEPTDRSSSTSRSAPRARRKFDKCVPGGAVTDEIAANPLGFYLNAHTATFPAGAVRGQLQPQPLFTQVLPTPVRVVRLPAAELARHPGARVELDDCCRPDSARRRFVAARCECGARHHHGH